MGFGWFMNRQLGNWSICPRFCIFYFIWWCPDKLIMLPSCDHGNCKRSSCLVTLQKVRKCIAFYANIFYFLTHMYVILSRGVLGKVSGKKTFTKIQKYFPSNPVRISKLHLFTHPGVPRWILFWYLRPCEFKRLAEAWFLCVFVSIGTSTFVPQNKVYNFLKVKQC
jgi:hypothetical protein